MILYLRKEISIDDLLTAIRAQHGAHGLQYVGYRALQILVNEYDVAMPDHVTAWLEDLKTRRMPNE